MIRNLQQQSSVKEQTTSGSGRFSQSPCKQLPPSQHKNKRSRRQAFHDNENDATLSVSPSPQKKRPRVNDQHNYDMNRISTFSLSQSKNNQNNCQSTSPTRSGFDQRDLTRYSTNQHREPFSQICLQQVSMFEGAQTNEEQSTKLLTTEKNVIKMQDQQQLQHSYTKQQSDQKSQFTIDLSNIKKEGPAGIRDHMPKFTHPKCSVAKTLVFEQIDEEEPKELQQSFYSDDGSEFDLVNHINFIHHQEQIDNLSDPNNHHEYVDLQLYLVKQDSEEEQQEYLYYNLQAEEQFKQDQCSLRQALSSQLTTGKQKNLDMAFCLEHSAAVFSPHQNKLASNKQTKNHESISMYQFKVTGVGQLVDFDQEYDCNFGFTEELERVEAQEQAKFQRPLSRSKSMFLIRGEKESSKL